MATIFFCLGQTTRVICRPQPSLEVRVQEFHPQTLSVRPPPPSSLNRTQAGTLWGSEQQRNGSALPNSWSGSRCMGQQSLFADRNGVAWVQN